MEQTGIRINKFLSEAGVCSRREADRQIEAGNVTIDGYIAVCGDKVLPGMQVCFLGEEVKTEEEAVFLALNKPRGIVCTAEKREKNNVIDFLNYPKRIYPVGRLDKDSEGLLLLTNQGELANKIMRARNFHEKEYIVTVYLDITPEFLEGMRTGVYLPGLDATTRRCLIEQKGKRTFSIILTQGLNRQIRRMCEAFGDRVRRLVRVRIMHLSLGDLSPGEYRPLTVKEIRKLQQLCEADE